MRLEAPREVAAPGSVRRSRAFLAIAFVCCITMMLLYDELVGVMYVDTSAAVTDAESSLQDARTPLPMAFNATEPIKPILSPRLSRIVDDHRPDGSSRIRISRTTTYSNRSTSQRAPNIPPSPPRPPTTSPTAKRSPAPPSLSPPSRSPPPLSLSPPPQGVGVTVLFVAWGNTTALNEAILSATSVCQGTPAASVILLTGEAPELEAAGRKRLPLVCPNHTLLPAASATTSSNGGSDGDSSGVCAPARLLVRTVTHSSFWSFYERAGVHAHTFLERAGGGGRFAKQVLSEIVAGDALLLPRCLDRLLVLDTDTVVARDLTPMWEASFKRFLPGQVLMAKKVRGRPVGGSCVSNAAYGNATVEFNSGVMLWDVTAMRRTQWAKHFIAQLGELRRSTCDGGFMVNKDAICVGDQVLLSVACARRPEACAVPLDPPSLHAEYCYAKYDFDAASRDNSCVAGFVGAANRRPARLQLTFSDCKLPSHPRHLIFHFNCNHKGASLRWLGVPDRQAQAAIDAYYALSDRHGWEPVEDKPTAPPQPTVSVTTITGWRTCNKYPPLPPSPRPTPTSPAPPPPNRSPTAVQQVSSGDQDPWWWSPKGNDNERATASRPTPKPTSPSRTSQSVPNGTSPAAVAVSTVLKEASASDKNNSSRSSNSSGGHVGGVVGGERFMHRIDMREHRPHSNGISGCAFEGNTNLEYCTSGGRMAIKHGPMFPSTDKRLLDKSIHIPTTAVESLRAKYDKLKPRLTGNSIARPVKVAIMGGSMTLGGNCVNGDQSQREHCSWPGQLKELLQRRYGDRVAVHLAARPATSLDWSIAMLPKLVPRDSDIILVDYVQNDNRPSLDDLYDPTPIDMQVSVATERWLIKLRDYFGKDKTPVLVFFLSFPPPGFSTTPKFRSAWFDQQTSKTLRKVMWGHYLNYAQVLHHYGVPYVTLQHVLWSQGPDLMPTPGLWKSATVHRWKNEDFIDKHPDWFVHKACADTVFHALQVLESDSTQKQTASTGGGVGVASSWPEAKDTFWPKERLGVFGACTSYMSFLSAENEKAAPLRADPGWKRYEDRPGKPGWIAEASFLVSTIHFVVRCGDEHVVGIEYMESYEGMGTVDVTMASLEGRVHIFEGAYDRGRPGAVTRRRVVSTRQEVLNGTCTAQNSMRTTKEFTVQCERTGMDTSLVQVSIKHSGAAKAGGKFKIVGVYSC